MLQIFFLSFECLCDGLTYQQYECNLRNIETYSEEIYQWADVCPIEYVY
jgi:hypothetical protein